MQWVFLAGVLLAAAGPAHARAIYGKAAVVVRDGRTRAPLEGARVSMFYAGSEPVGEDREKSEPKGNTGETDSAGYATARVYLGRAQTRWEPLMGAHRQKQVDVRAVRVRAEKAGYRTLEAVANVFFVSFRKGKGTYVFLDEVLLAPDRSSEASRVLPQAFAVDAKVEPGWGDYSTPFLLQVKTQVPAVLAHEYSEPLLELVATVPGRDEPVDLKDDGRAPDALRGDGIYSAAVRLPAKPRPQVTESVAVHLDTLSSQHSLVLPGENRIVTGEGSLLLGGRRRKKMAAEYQLPVRWVAASSAGAAERVYRDRWAQP